MSASADACSSSHSGFYETEAIVARKGDGSLGIEKVRLSEPNAEEVLVKIVCSSICRSDVKTAMNKFLIKAPCIPGHEGAGVVTRVGAAAASRVKVGDHVVLSFGSCSTCRFCQTGRPAACKRLFAYNFHSLRDDDTPIAWASSDNLQLGALFFSQSSWCRVALVHMSCVVPVDLSIKELRFAGAFSCGVQTGAGTIFNVCKPPVGSGIAIFGAGGVGLAAVMAAKLTSPKYIVITDMQPDRLELARSLGATHTILASDDVVSKVREITDGEMLDYVLECVGVPALTKTAHECLAPFGEIIQVGGPTDRTVPPTFSVSNHLNQSKSYRGTHQGGSNPLLTIPLLISLWRQGKFPVERLLTSYNWRDVTKAVADMESGKVIKPVLVFEDEGDV